MKTFIMNNWRKIIFVIAGIVILVNFISMVTTPATIADDYYRYGPSYEEDIIDKASNLNINAEEKTEEGAETLSQKSGMPMDAARPIIILTILIIAILIVQNAIDGSSASAKK